MATFHAKLDHQIFYAVGLKEFRGMARVFRTGEDTRFVFVHEQQIDIGQTGREQFHPFPARVPTGIKRGCHPRRAGGAQIHSAQRTHTGQAENICEMEMTGLAGEFTRKGNGIEKHFPAASGLMEELARAAAVDQSYSGCCTMYATRN